MFQQQIVIERNWVFERRQSTAPFDSDSSRYSNSVFESRLPTVPKESGKTREVIE